MIQPPSAKREPQELTIHDHTRIDPYYWLRERENKDVLSYLEAEKPIHNDHDGPYNRAAGAALQ